jgi:hypothetical protein
MALKIRFSTVGLWERVSDSVQPVHSWKESQITEGRLAFSSAAAMAGTMPGGIAIMEAVAVQNLRNPRRLIPCRRMTSPRVSFFAMSGLLVQ